MEDNRNQIVSGILRAKSELEQVLYEMEKLPPVSESAVHFAAHALNNFLTVTGGTVELLLLVLAKYPDQQVRTGLEALQQATNLMTHTVSQMVNAESGGEPDLRFEKVELPVMAQRFRVYYQRIADQKQIQCLSESHEDVPSVWTDRVATAAALDNLFSNAVKYSPAGKRIWVEVVPQDEWVVCRVRDEGPGLSREDQAKLFQRGIQLTSKPTAGEPSTGYGLAVAKELIEKVGGRIWCESVLGGRSLFLLSASPIPRIGAWNRAESAGPTIGLEVTNRDSCRSHRWRNRRFARAITSSSPKVHTCKIYYQNSYDLS